LLVKRAKNPRATVPNCLTVARSASAFVRRGRAEESPRPRTDDLGQHFSHRHLGHLAQVGLSSAVRHPGVEHVGQGANDLHQTG
jgi:hypothetical protein